MPRRKRPKHMFATVKQRHPDAAKHRPGTGRRIAGANQVVDLINVVRPVDSCFLLMKPAFVAGIRLVLFNQLVLTGKLNALLGSRGGNWEILTASAFVTIIVPLTVFFSLQRYFVRGLLAGSVKGG